MPYCTRVHQGKRLDDLMAKRKKPQPLVRVNADTKKLIDEIAKEMEWSIPQVLHHALKLATEKESKADE